MKTITTTEQENEFVAYGTACTLLEVENGEVVVIPVSIKEIHEDEFIMEKL